MKNIDQTCSNCRFLFEQDRNITCRRQSAQQISMATGYGLWPRVSPEDWCGEWGGTAGGRKGGTPRIQGGKYLEEEAKKAFPSLTISVTLLGSKFL